MTHGQAREDSDLELLMTLAPPPMPSEGAFIVCTAVATHAAGRPRALFCALLNIQFLSIFFFHLSLLGVDGWGMSGETTN